MSGASGEEWGGGAAGEVWGVGTASEEWGGRASGVLGSTSITVVMGSPAHDPPTARSVLSFTPTQPFMPRPHQCHASFILSYT